LSQIVGRGQPQRDDVADRRLAGLPSLLFAVTEYVWLPMVLVTRDPWCARAVGVKARFDARSVFALVQEKLWARFVEFDDAPLAGELIAAVARPQRYS